ncbi:MAG: methyl-accepting chemotaxis protein [Candidatus Omnitrophica bacterium]|nr:methyl-accepting chemotaxis protein [Candidatus Omnitrophota bacterium]
MRRRVPFVWQGNLQLGWLLLLVIVVALGLLAAAWFNYGALETIFKQEVFSAHLSAVSSEALVWRAIVEVTLLSAGATLFIGAIVLLGALWYLERLFRTLSAGLERLASGAFSYRIRSAGILGGSTLVQAFNRAAESMQQRADTLRALIKTGITTAGAEDPARLAQLRTLQHQLRQSSAG